MPWPVPPSEATTRMFAALSPERLESESLASSERSESSRRSEPSEHLMTSGGSGGRGSSGRGRDGRAKQPRRTRRLALVSGLSVLLAVGVTAGGARLIAGRTSLSMEQPTTACPTSENCAAAGGPYGALGSGQALGETSAPGDPTGNPGQSGQDQSGQEDSGTTGSGQDDDTGQGGSAAPEATPVSTATSKGKDRDHASARTRTPSTAAPRASAHASPRVGDAPATDTAAPDDPAEIVPDNGVTPGDTTLDDTGNTGNTGNTGGASGTDAADAGTTGSTGTGTDTARTKSALAAGGPAVRVRFTVTERDGSGYAARLTVRNEGPALPAWTIRLAVGGQVTAVEGADWRQQGDTLTLSSQTALSEGGTLTLTVHADGASAAPADCVLSEGRCEVAGPGPSRHRD
ncbi:hypothetical protein [Microbispora sitophila]|uniref:hypothetical protein n=1 Tax=Microbispora sitophila TaxID=2771537 RepID=UPI001D01329A|nr:hypothetical protein [Microbispora sitophila]